MTNLKQTVKGVRNALAHYYKVQANAYTTFHSFFNDELLETVNSYLRLTDRLNKRKTVLEELEKEMFLKEHGVSPNDSRYTQLDFENLLNQRFLQDKEIIEIEQELNALY